jgi:hypothetical protein
MLGKVSSLLILGAVLLSMIAPANLACIHLPDNNKVLVTFDVCHASSPLLQANANVPFCPGQIFCCLSVPEFAGFYAFLRPLFKSSLIAFQIENPPRA